MPSSTIFIFSVKDILGLEDPDPTLFHHVRTTRTHANKYIIAKLIEQVKKTSAKVTKSIRKNCEVEKEEMG